MLRQWVTKIRGNQKNWKSLLVFRHVVCRWWIAIPPPRLFFFTRRCSCSQAGLTVAAVRSIPQVSPSVAVKTSIKLSVTTKSEIPVRLSLLKKKKNWKQWPAVYNEAAPALSAVPHLLWSCCKDCCQNKDCKRDVKCGAHFDEYTHSFSFTFPHPSSYGYGAWSYAANRFAFLASSVH